MTNNENLYTLTIGDWSCDGHSLYRQYAVQTNETMDNIRSAYFKACQQSRIKFHNGKEGDIDGANYVVVCTECDDDGLSKEAEERFKAFGVNVEDEKYQRCMWYGSHRFEDIENFAYLLMDFIKQSLPAMEYEFVEMSVSKLVNLPRLNGFWQQGFNLGFGYGLNNVFCDESDDYHGDGEDEDDEKE